MVLLVCTSLAQAKPFITHLHLKFSTLNKQVQLYTNNEYTLVITGNSKVEIAMAITTCFLNFKIDRVIHIGIAINKNNLDDNLFLVSKIVDQETGREFYPDLLALNKNVFTSIAPIWTIAKIDSYKHKFGTEWLDAESSAIFETVNFFLTVDKINLIKIGVNSTNSTNLINKYFSQIISLLEKLNFNETNKEEIFSKLDLELIEDFAIKHYFTLTQKRDFIKLLINYYLQQSESIKTILSSLAVPNIRHKKDNKIILLNLQKKLDF